MDALQKDCSDIVDWFTQNDLELNASKTELMIHSSKKNQSIAKLQKIYINECEIKCSDQVKSLGLIKDQLLTWKPHIEHVSKKATKSLWKLRCLKPVLTYDQMKLAIETLILTQVYYMAIVWGNAPKKYLKCINKIIKDAYYLLDNGLSTSEWLFIEEMHQYQSLVLSHASVQKFTPPCFFNIINCAALKRKKYEVRRSVLC